MAGAREGSTPPDPGPGAATSPGGDDPDGGGAIDRLERWVRFGGHWAVVDTTGDSVTLSLRRCDGGEELERVTCRSTELTAWQAAR